MIQSLIVRLVCVFALANIISAAPLLFAAYGSSSGSGGLSSTPQTNTGLPQQTNIPLNQPSLGSQRLLSIKGATGATGARNAPLPQTQRLLPTTQSISVLYTMPGIATLQSGQWVGSADLYNLGSSIGLVVEVITPSGGPIGLGEQMIINKAIPILKEGGINAQTAITGTTPLPYLHFLFMIYPIDKGYVAYCSGRLFENAKVARVFLKPDIYWQVITWEKQELLLFPSNELAAQIESAVNMILKDFITQSRVKPEEKKK